LARAKESVLNVPTAHRLMAIHMPTDPLGLLLASFRTGEWDYAGLFAIAADRDVAGRHGARKDRRGNQGL